MAFAGDLKKLPLADVFQSIHQNALTGALAIRDGHGERLVAFKEGYVAGCAAPVGEEHGIADELVRRKKIEAKDARPSRFFRRKGSLLKSLQRRNLMDASEFAAMTRSLVLERVYDCFLLEDGTFEFLETYDPARFDEDEAAAELKVAPAEILMEAMRRIDEFKRIKRAVPSFREVYVATRTPTDEDTPLVRDVLTFTAQGTMPLHEVFHSTPHTKFACCEAVLTLVNQGDLRVATAPEYLELGKKAEAKGDLEAAAAYYGRGIAYERGNKELNNRHIAILEKLKRNQEAADERKRYAGILLEHGDRRGAQEQYGRASELAPSDALPLERLLDLQVEAKDLKEASHTADRLVRVYLQIGLGDKAKGVYPRLLVLSPRDRSLRERLAEVHQKLNEPSTAATIWKELAQEEIDKGDHHDAALLLRRALEAQPDDQRTQALLKDLETGEHAERRRRMRGYVFLSVASVVVGLAAAWVVYEARAALTMHELTLGFLRTADRGSADILGAIEAREAQREALNLTIFASRWNDAEAVTLTRLFVRELSDEAERGPRFERTDQRLKIPEVQTILNEVLDGLEAAVESAEAAEARGDPDQAQKELPALVERATRARTALARAGARVSSTDEGRSARGLVEDQEKLYPLLARIQLLKARLAIKTKECRDALEDELKRRPLVAGPARAPGATEAASPGAGNGAAPQTPTDRTAKSGG